MRRHDKAERMLLWVYASALFERDFRYSRCVLHVAASAHQRFMRARLLASRM